MSGDLVTASNWSFTDLVSGSNKGVMSFDLFKFISDKSLDVGSALSLIGYFYYFDRRLGVAFNRAMLPILGIVGGSYIQPNNVIMRTGGLVLGEFAANKFYLESYFNITQDEMLYGTGASLIGGYVFKYLYDTFVYKPAEPSVA